MSVDVNELFKIVAENGGSDLHLRYDLQPKMRKNGVLVPLPGYEDTIFDAETVSDLCFRTMEPVGIPEATQNSDRDDNTYGKFVHNKHGLNYAYEAYFNGKQYGRWRISVYISRKKEVMAARLLQDEPLTFHDLDVHPTIPKILNNSKGIIFVTGETGSGKSTLMGAMVDHINETMPVNIISLEDPIEMIHEPKMATVTQRDVGLGIDESSYKSALANALRQDPDIILIGEIRDLETMRTAFEAANTGHLVITTLHTSSAAETVNRVLKMYPAEERDGVAFDLSRALVGVISQQLLPNSAGNGRVAVNEILVTNQQVRSVIANHAGNAEILHNLISSRDRGSISFEQHMLEKLQKGDVLFEDVYYASTDKEYFDRVADEYERTGEYREVDLKPISDEAQETIPEVVTRKVSPKPAPKPVQNEPEEVVEPEKRKPAPPSFGKVNVAGKGLPIPPKGRGLPLGKKEQTDEEDDTSDSGDSDDFELSELGEPVSHYGIYYTDSPLGENRDSDEDEGSLDLNLENQKSLTISFPKREVK